MLTTPKTALQLLREKTLGEGKLVKKHNLRAGKLLVNQGEEAAAKYMLEHVSKGPVANFGAPAKCLIVAQSRPFEEWPIAKVNAEIQKYIYGQSLAEVPLDSTKLMSKESTGCQPLHLRISASLSGAIRSFRQDPPA